MRDDLRALLDEVKAGVHTPESFSAGLEAIHRRHLGDAADEAEHVEVRRKAMKRFLKMPETIEHHHQLERLAKALGVEGALASKGR